MKYLMPDKKGYTFLELMVTVTILSIGIVGVYKVLITSLDYQRQLSCRLYATNLMEHEIALLENQFKANGEFPDKENGKVVEVLLDRRSVLFEFSLEPATLESNLAGLLPVRITLSWPDQGRMISLKRDIFLVNLKVGPAADVDNPIP